MLLREAGLDCAVADVRGECARADSYSPTDLQLARGTFLPAEILEVEPQKPLP